MKRIVLVGSVVLLLLSSAVEGRQGGAVLLDKKDSLTLKDPAYMPDLKNLPPKVKAAKEGPELMAFVAGNPHKVYPIKLKKGDKITITLTSIPPANPNTNTGIDTVVIVENAKKAIVDFNDDDETAKTLDSRLVFTAPEDGDYRIIAIALHALVKNKTGDFQIKIVK